MKRGGRRKPGSAAANDGGGAATWRAELRFPTVDEPSGPPAGFIERAEAAGIAFEPGEVDRLGRYVALLLAANEVINLTAIRSAEEAWDRHVLDSLTLLSLLAEAGGEDGGPVRLLDVGSGGGLPGVPLAICAPSVRVTLLDATEKKCRFLRHVASELDLENVRVIHGRAERAGHDRGKRVDSGGVTRHDGAMRGAFDVVTARAVGRLATLAELTVPFARTGGLVALIKGERADEEVAEAKQALHMLHASHAGTIETPTGRVVVLEKRRETPKPYPRPDGEPKRRPLGVAAENERRR